MDTSENKVKAKVLNTRYTLTEKEKNMISPVTAQFLMGCLQYDKKARLTAESLASNSVFDSVRDTIENMKKSMLKVNEMTESKLRKDTVKGTYFSYVMSYSFLFDLGLYLAKKKNTNLASLYLFKYCFSEISALKNLLNNRVNVINHGDWGAFVQTPEFANSFKIIDNLIAKSQKAF